MELPDSSMVEHKILDLAVVGSSPAPVTKVCCVCKLEKDISWFAKKGKGKFSYECKICHRKYHKAFYEKNKTTERARITKNKQLRIDKYNRLKATLVCKHCGEITSECLQFHHTNPSAKEATISNAIRNRGWKFIESEMAKCIVLCANCHIKEHIRLRDTAV